jgi:hypothetical protein
MEQYQPKVFAPGAHMALENNHGTSHPYLNIGRPDDRYAKLKIYVSELILDNYEY